MREESGATSTGLSAAQLSIFSRLMIGPDERAALNKTIELLERLGDVDLNPHLGIR
jgi:hypothetical protein